MNKNYVVYTRKKNNDSNKFKKTLRDYTVPLIILGLIVFVIFYFLFKDDDENKNNDTKNNNIIQNISSNFYVIPEEGSDVYYLDKNSEKTLILSRNEIGFGNTTVVKEGTTLIETTEGKFRLNKLGELKNLSKGKIQLDASDLWGAVKSSLEIKMKYANLTVSPGTVFSLTQNEALSTIYVIKGSIKVENLSKTGNSTQLGDNQKIIIQNKDASSDSIDLSLKKDNIDNFFLNGDWYNKNKVDLMGEGIIDSTNIGEISNSSNSGSKKNNTGYGVIELNDIRDEMTVSSPSLNIGGVYYSDFIAKISLDGKDATMDLQNKTFSFGTVELTSKENNLVIKSYDSEGNVISKDVYTIYFNGTFPEKEKPATNNTASNNTTSSNSVAVDPAKFVFTAPGNSPFNTTESFVTIRGTVPKGVIQKITVNGYTLQQYVEYSDNWRYHASVDYGNLQDGTNVYEVKYFGEGGSLLYANSFTIVRASE